MRRLALAAAGVAVAGAAALGTYLATGQGEGGLAVSKVSEDATTITLGWTPAGDRGYVFYADGRRVSWSADASRSTVRIAKGAATYRVEAISQTSSGTYPPPAQPPPQGLKWAAPALEAQPLTYNVTNSNRAFGDVTSPLPTNRDVVLRFPSTPITAGAVQVFGGRNVVIVGGEIRRDTSQGCSNYDPIKGYGLYIGGQAGTVHIEGVKIHGRGLSQALVFWASGNQYGTTVQVQNSYFETLEVVGSSAAHSDGIQLYSGPNVLRIYQSTIVSQGVGLQLQTYDLAPDAMPTPQLHHFERLNVRQLPQAANCPDPRPYHRTYALWKGLKGAGGSQARWPQFNRDFWLELADTDDEARYHFTAYSANNTADPAAGLAGWNPGGAWPVTGESIRYGSPPADFAPASAGTGYVSPSGG